MKKGKKRRHNGWLWIKKWNELEGGGGLALAWFLSFPPLGKVGFLEALREAAEQEAGKVDVTLN